MKEKYVPEPEIARRVSRLQSYLVNGDIEAALVIYKMDYFYFSGTAKSTFSGLIFCMLAMRVVGET